MGCACCDGYCIGIACPYRESDASAECENCGHDADYRVDGIPMCLTCASHYITQIAEDRGMDEWEVFSYEMEELAEKYNIDLEEIYE